MDLFAGLLGIAVGLIVLVIAFAVVIYNKLTRLRNTAQSSWSDIDVQLKKRYENPVEATNGLASEWKIVIRPVKGGVMLYLPEDAPGFKNSADAALKKMGIE